MYAETRCDEAELGWYEPSPDKFTFRGLYAKKISITPQLPQHFKNNFTPNQLICQMLVVSFARKMRNYKRMIARSWYRSAIWY